LGSFRRIQKFLLLDEHLESAKTDPLNPEEAEEIASEQKLDPVPTNAAISTKGAEFGWDVDGPSIVCLGDMNLAKGSFTAITGPIGCGKSTLLQGLLSETTCTKGSVQVSAAKIAYCPQTPWIYDGTIRDNIVGESEFDSVWYKIVLSSCELDSDLDYMPAGDATMVGSMGSGVSGGQKQRIVCATLERTLPIGLGARSERATDVYFIF
jgi:ABC-type bacteriocin/lantibiotic exporter with double-glycine peptidase domain